MYISEFIKHLARKTADEKREILEKVGLSPKTPKEPE